MGTRPRADRREGPQGPEGRGGVAGTGVDVRDALALLSGWKGTARMLRQRSLIEGVWNGRRNWLAVAAVVWGAHGLRKAVHRQEKVVWRGVVRPGGQVHISEPIVRPTRRQRRKLARRGGPPT